MRILRVTTDYIPSLLTSKHREEKFLRLSSVSQNRLRMRVRKICDAVEDSVTHIRKLRYRSDRMTDKESFIGVSMSGCQGEHSM